MSKQAQQDSTHGDGTHICSFPDDRDKFPEYKMKMEAHLAARQVLSVVIKPSPSITHKQKMSDNDYADWLEDCERNHEEAMTETAAAANSASAQANLHKSPTIVKHREISKCRRAADIIISLLQ